MGRERLCKHCNASLSDEPHGVTECPDTATCIFTTVGRADLSTDERLMLDAMFELARLGRVRRAQLDSALLTAVRDF